METTQLNIKNLEKILKAFKAKPVVARVGILGESGRRQSSGKTNAEIGACHEFGTTTLPVRSFLRLPISSLMQKYLDNSGAFDKDVLKEVVAKATFTPWIKKMAVVAESIVSDAFDSGGFGTWAPSNMARKQNHQTLVETQQLRNSITSEVKEQS